MADSNDEYITEEPEVILYEPPDQLIHLSSTDQDQYDHEVCIDDPIRKKKKLPFQYHLLRPNRIPGYVEINGPPN